MCGAVISSPPAFTESVAAGEATGTCVLDVVVRNADNPLRKRIVTTEERFDAINDFGIGFRANKNRFPIARAAVTEKDAHQVRRNGKRFFYSLERLSHRNLPAKNRISA